MSARVLWDGQWLRRRTAKKRAHRLSKAYLLGAKRLRDYCNGSSLLRSTRVPWIALSATKCDWDGFLRFVDEALRQFQTIVLPALCRVLWLNRTGAAA